MEIWDYFMRRKGLLLAVLVFFFASSSLSYRALQSNASKRETPRITISDWGQDTSAEAPEVDVPHTGMTENFTVISPRDLVNLTDDEPTTIEYPYEISPDEGSIQDFPSDEPTSEMIDSSSELTDFEYPTTIEGEPLDVATEGSAIDVPEEISTTPDEANAHILADIAVPSTSTPSDDPDITVDTDVMLPSELVVSAAESVNEVNRPRRFSIAYGIFLGLCTIIVIAFCSYTLYWHFMR